MATPNMGLTKPTEGGSSGVWDTILNNDTDTIDAHDHTSGKGALVPSAGLNINAAVAWGGYNLTNMGELGFATTTTGTVAKGLRVVANELTWRTSGGVDVQLTNGTSLNTTLVGGITGDYTTTDADCEYDDATKAYKMLQDESPDHFAKVKCGDIHLYEATSGITNFITLKSPSSLAASYDWIYPTALPASGTEIVTVTSAGQMDTTATPSVTSLTVTDPGVKHGDRVLQLSAFGQWTNGAGGPAAAFTDSAFGDSYVVSTALGDWVKFAIPLTIGDRIRSVAVNYKDSFSNTCTATLYRAWDGAAPTSVATSTGASSSWDEITLSSIDHTILADNIYFLMFKAGSTGSYISGAIITYDRP